MNMNISFYFLETHKLSRMKVYDIVRFYHLYVQQMRCLLSCVALAEREGQDYSSEIIPLGSGSKI